MLRERRGGDGAAMSSLAAHDLFHVRDRLPMPLDGSALLGRAAREDSYPIHVTGSLAETVERLAGVIEGRRVGIVTDTVVEALYGPDLVRGVRALADEVLVRAIPAGEASKSLDRAVELWHWLARGPLARRDVLLSFGGGVVCDLGGWVASAYMRGLPCVNVPTTLLAQVDGALGGKVAVNHPVAKNLLGAFYQPSAVVADISFLASQERRHLAAGLAECVKKAMIASPEYWRFIHRNADAVLAREPAALRRLVRGAAAIKTELIARDPYEHDLRRPLNFGHTIGHPLETVSGYAPLLHGEAVAFGMVVEARIAAARGLLAPGLLAHLAGLLRRCGLPTTAAELPPGISADAVLAAMEKVRLIRDGSLRYVLPVGLGVTVIADDVGEREVRRALAECGLE
jgi:3-dehydroquinate synthase